MSRRRRPANIYARWRSQIDVGGQVGPDDRFDLIVANRRAATGESQEGPLLYAAIERAGASDVRLMKWNINGRAEWVDANGAGRQVAAMTWPVAAGSPRASASVSTRSCALPGCIAGSTSAPVMVRRSSRPPTDRVTRAGWAGGYGQQVRLAHGGGMGSSYSHMSRIVADPGSFVRQGQLIGYVGSSGLSTGPHLHYEVYRNGAAVNPLGVKFASRSLLEGEQLERFKARLAQLMAIGTRTTASAQPKG